VLARPAYLAAQTVGDDTAALSLIVGTPTSPVAVASSTVAAQTLDAWQLESGNGPSVLAVECQRTVVSSDLRHDRRWPPPTEAHDARAVVGAVAAPLRRGDQVEGVLTAYLPGDQRITTRLVEQIEVLSASVGSLLQELGLRTHLEGLAADMQSALASRSVIEQAKGI